MAACVFIFLLLCLALSCDCVTNRRRSVSSSNNGQHPVIEHLLPRRTFLHTIFSGMQDERDKSKFGPLLAFLKQQYSRVSYIKDYGGVTTNDSQFCAALFPIGYITPKLLELRKRPSFESLFAAELELPSLGYFSFPATTDKINSLSVTQIDPSDSFEPDVGASYIVKNPKVVCTESAKVEARMKTLYTTPERAVCALQLGPLACTMASFDMAYYAHKTALTGKSAPENWTRRENIGGAGHSGGRTESEVRNDFEKYGVRAEAITRPKEHSFKKRDVELSSQDAHDIDTFIQKYGPCIGSLQHYGHANIIDGFYFSETTDEPVAMFIRDPMYALAFAIPWEKARVMVEYDCLFLTKK